MPVIVVPFATGIRGSGKPEMVTTAMYLAHQKMEELMKFNYCQAPDLTPGTYTLAGATYYRLHVDMDDFLCDQYLSLLQGQMSVIKRFRLL